MIASGVMGSGFLKGKQQGVGSTQRFVSNNYNIAKTPKEPTDQPRTKPPSPLDPPLHASHGEQIYAVNKYRYSGDKNMLLDGWWRFKAIGKIM